MNALVSVSPYPEATGQIAQQMNRWVSSESPDPPYMDQKICPPVTSLTLLKMMASRREVPGRPYVIIVSLRYIDVQKRPLTMGDASAILPSIPFRINSHTAGILLLMSVFLIRGVYEVRN